MKNIIIKLSALCFLLVFLASCDKRENKIYFEGGTAPSLTANKTGSIPMSYATRSQEAIRLNWTNPNYQFTTGLSSHTVVYQLEIDTTGSNFTNPKKQTVSFSGDMGAILTQDKLNDYLTNQLKLVTDIPHNIEMRVRASMENSTVPLYSNVLKFTAIPFSTPPKVQPPAAGNLWMVGDASPNGWDNPLKPAYVTVQKFTKVSNTLYTLTITLPGGGNYKLLQDNGVWGTQYHMLPGGTWNAGDFEMKDSDPGFPGPPTAGNYKITVDFQSGKYEVVKL